MIVWRAFRSEVVGAKGHEDWKRRRQFEDTPRRDGNFVAGSTRSKVNRFQDTHSGGERKSFPKAYYPTKGAVVWGGWSGRFARVGILGLAERWRLLGI